MAERIEQERLFQKVGSGESICKSCYHKNACRGIGTQPCIGCNQYKNAAEVEPVIHSEWEITEIDHAYGHKCYHCPECGWDEWRYESTKRCPNCGAKMDLEG